MWLLPMRVRGACSDCLVTVVTSVAMVCLGWERGLAEDLDGILGGTGGARDDCWAGAFLERVGTP